MALLALAINIIALAVGKGKGLAIYFLGTVGLVVLMVLMGAKRTPLTPQEVPIAIAGTVLGAVSVWIGQWKGLIVWLVGTVAIIVAAMTGLL